MNIFRFCGDMCHLLSFVLLMLRLRRSKTANGISLRTQQMLAIVFLTRYVDLFTAYHSLYNSLMKVVYIAASVTVVYTLQYREPWRTSYDSVRDNFPHWRYLVAPCAVLALIVNDAFLKYGYFEFVREILWAFSEYLEAVAIIPQLVLLQRLKEVENITSNYVFSIGAYRAFYVMNWVYRYLRSPYYSDWVSWTAGTVQTALFVDFFYYYAKSKWAGMDSVPLPT